MKTKPIDPAALVALAMRSIYHSGMTTLSGGNISLMDRQGRIWITPGGVDKGSLGPADIVMVDQEGKCSGRHKPSSELPFHRAAYRARSGIGAVLHAHPPALVAFSAARLLPEQRILPALACGRLGMAAYALPGSPELGEAVAGRLSAGDDAVILMNHGVVVAGQDLEEAYQRFRALEFSARVEIAARRLLHPDRFKTGTSLPITPTHQAEDGAQSGLGRSALDPSERRAARALIGIAERAREKGLCPMLGDSFSMRLGPSAFILALPSPALRGDIRCLSIGIDEGRMLPEALPCPASTSSIIKAHADIYAARAELGALILASPEHASAFAAVGIGIDTRLLPESYILLRSPPCLPRGSLPRDWAEALGPAQPLLVLGGLGVLASGRDPLEAYDRLEVAEFSARAIIGAKSLGAILPIGPREIEDIVRAFKLPS
jgi:L-fuculose-phosphate aldolase